MIRCKCYHKERSLIMTSKSDAIIPSSINDFKTFKLNGMLRDVKRLSNDELMLVKKEIDTILSYEEQSLYE